MTTDAASMPTKAADVPSAAQQMRLIADRVAGWVLLALVVWLLAAGRWGSYVGWTARQLYVTEIALAVVVVLVLVAGKRPKVKVVDSYVLTLLCPLLLLLLWALVRTPSGLSYGGDALRDLAPYAYAVVAVLVLQVAQPRRVRWLLAGGVTAHAAWVELVLHRPLTMYHLPALGRTRVFELRTDFDAATAGMGAVLCLVMAQASRRWPERAALVLIGGWSGYLALAINNRAGLLATAAAAVWAGLEAFQRETRRRSVPPRRRRQIASVAAVLAVLAIAVVLIITPAGKRLAGTFEPGRGAEENATASARVEVWKRVFSYIGDEPSRVVAGVGMGPDYLTQAHAVQIYDPGQTLGVRAAHEFLIGTYARLGLIGLLLHLVLVVLGWRLAWRAAVQGPRNDLVRLAAILVVAIPVAAAVGVVLESPFGAVPYFWGYGTLVISAAEGRSSRVRRVKQRREVTA